ncbi:mitochondrial import receptor subunit TOM40B isoform X1 [Patagioenas fasciata]|uniref:mitochondrial import receptor subunit TOM40B isoform X1 n=1 Tax=Patagioenas fasciata TaxID=372321 RepID=UPI003A992A8F
MGNALGPAGPAPRRGEPLGSPGSFDELHRQCKEVFPQQMEGVKLIVTKTLSSHFQVTHTVHMSTLGPSSYHFNATFVGDRQLSPTEAFPTLVGDMDNSGSLNAQVLQLVAERIRTKAVFQTHQAKFVTWQFDGEYRGDDCTATLTLGNPDILGESERHPPPGAGGGDGLSPAAGGGRSHPDAGGQVHGYAGGPWGQGHSPGVPTDVLTPGGTPAALALRSASLPALKWVATLNVGYGGAHASYYHRANEQVQVGVELEANTRLQDTTFAFGYQLNLPRANMVFRGLVDSNWSVGGVLEKKLPPLPVTLALGAFLNHWKNRFHCGFSVIVG